VTDLIHIFSDNNFFNLKLFMGAAVTMEHWRPLDTQSLSLDSSHQLLEVVKKLSEVVGCKVLFLFHDHALACFSLSKSRVCYTLSCSRYSHDYRYQRPKQHTRLWFTKMQFATCKASSCCPSYSEDRQKRPELPETGQAGKFVDLVGSVAHSIPTS